MNDLFYYTGMIFMAIVAVISIYFLLFLVWVYLSVCVSFWWIHIKAEEKYGGVVKKEFVKKRCWKIRLLFLMLADWEMVLQANDTEITGRGYKADYTGLYPKVKLTNLHV